MAGSNAGFHFMSDYLRCRKYFYWKYWEGIEPVWEAPTLMLGDSVHVGLAAWYLAMQEGKPPHLRLQASINAALSNLLKRKDAYKFTDTYVQHIALVRTILEQYTLVYSTQQWKVLDVERELSTEMANGYIFTGRIDLNIINQLGNKYIVDHKTTSWSLAQLKKTLSATDQGTAYIFLWNKTHAPHEKVNGIIFNIVRYYKDVVKPEDLDHHLVYRTDDDLERFELDAISTYEELSGVIAEGGRFVRNTASCYLYNRPCPYLDLCAGTSYEGLIGTTFRKREEIDIDGDIAWPYTGD